MEILKDNVEPKDVNVAKDEELRETLHFSQTTSANTVNNSQTVRHHNNDGHLSDDKNNGENLADNYDTGEWIWKEHKMIVAAGAIKAKTLNNV